MCGWCAPIEHMSILRQSSLLIRVYSLLRITRAMRSSYIWDKQGGSICYRGHGTYWQRWLQYNTESKDTFSNNLNFVGGQDGSLLTLFLYDEKVYPEAQKSLASLPSRGYLAAHLGISVRRGSGSTCLCHFLGQWTRREWKYRYSKPNDSYQGHPEV